jgi:hypothetical protein
MGRIRRGITEGFPYSLSRWTDLPAAKWEWFRAQLANGSIIAMDPRTGLPDRWSLAPEDTLGLVFWTRNSSNLVRDAALLSPYRKVVHFTLTGWHEVEQRAPGIEKGLDLLASAVDTFGVDNVRWRFSPVPIVDDVVERFSTLASRAAALGLKDVYISFLQPNDWTPEPRTCVERESLLWGLSKVTSLELVLCNEDSSTSVSCGVRRGICEDASRFANDVKAEKCGCALSVDPFSQNEACIYGCRYCYSGNRATAPRKRNTTRLPLLGNPRE